jgi:hypothetical protein
MGEYSTLEELSIDFVWLDDQLCEKIVGAGGKLRKLRIGTIGTKLTDRGVIALIEGCDALTALTLDEVQGERVANRNHSHCCFNDGQDG